MAKRVMVSMDKLSTTGTYEPSENETAYPQLGEGKASPSPVVLMAAGAILGSAATLLMKAMTK